MRRVAVVGAGISGLAAAYELAKAGVEVAIYEKKECLGDHARVVNVDGVDIHLGFTDFNPILFQNMTKLFEELDVKMEATDMSFSISLQDGNYEWGNRNGFRSLFAKKTNMVNPFVWYMFKEIFIFKNDAIRYLNERKENPKLDRSETLAFYLKSQGYSQLFQNEFLIPTCASIWSCSSEEVQNFSAYTVLSFCLNNHFLEVSIYILFQDVVNLLIERFTYIRLNSYTFTGHLQKDVSWCMLFADDIILLDARPQGLTARCLSQNYINKIREELKGRGCHIKLGCVVQTVSNTEKGCSVITRSGLEELYDECIITVHAPDALKILGKQATYEESRILGAFRYIYSDVYLHCDESLMPQNPTSWSARNFLEKNNTSYLTYWLNVLQNLGSVDRTLLVTLNPPSVPKNKILEWTTSYPVPSLAASKASLDLEKIQGKRRIFFCGSYQG
ncbi:uncharacterized protein LOC110019885 [Phalaenopsis equestris]|uniref:uncharacterized protein LOC110019885 n=1 Tax=Phalaenopsis equestris TaxID=78828 RepID=UPI0009E22D23|nr:uncharacterized protein LOC110019885 [Phalaenopsis equestris]